MAVWHEDCVKAKNGTEKELDVLKQQLKEEQELHRWENELQQDQVQQGAQHALMDEIALLQVIYPSQ